MGAALVPGGNDSLILFGLPRLWPNARLAFASRRSGGRVTGRRARKAG